MRSICGLLALLALPPVLAACGDRPAQAALRRNSPLVWRAVGTWSGRGSSQTGSFEVTTGALRVTWDARDIQTPGSGRLRVALHSAISGRALQTIVDVRGAGANTAYVQDDPRTSYFEVDAVGLDLEVRRAWIVLHVGRVGAR